MVDSRLQWQCKDELAAFTRSAVHDNLSAVRMRDVANQRESQAATLGVVDQRVTDPIELFKNFVLLAAGYAYAAIADLQLHRAVLTVKLDSQKLLRLRILQGVVDKVHQRARDGLAVHPYRRQIARDILLKHKPLLLNLVAVGFQRVAHQFSNIRFAEVVFFATCLDAREIQNIVYKGCKALALLPNDAIVLLIF